jgi:hypothetical protein
MAAQLGPEIVAIANRLTSSEEPLDVVLELEQTDVDKTGTRGERIAKQKACFDSVAEPVKACVLQSGGSIQGEAWIAATIKARIPAKALHRLRQIPGVLKIDVPHAISRER